MGFGLLLLGYTITYILTVGLGNYLFAGMLIGGFIMFSALSELRKYCPAFLYALIADVLLVICSFYETAAFFDGAFLLGLSIDSEYLHSIFDWIEFALNLLFNITLLYGIADLSKRVEYSEIGQKAYRNMVFVVMYNVLQVLMFIPGTVFQNDKAFFMTLLMIFQLIYAAFNFILIFKCYAKICPEGEEDMQRKPSRFAFVNKMREKQDEREQRAIESTKAYIENKNKKKQEQIKNKQNKKKKK